MNTALWVMQGLLAATFLAAGSFKLFVPVTTIAKKLIWVQMFPPLVPKLIGLAEILGAVGLILPWYLGIDPILTPVAAACLAVLMVGAARVHLKLKEPAAPAIIPALLCVVVAWGRM